MLAMLKACAFVDQFRASDFYHAVQRLFIATIIENVSIPAYEITIWVFTHLPAESKVLDFLVDTHCQEYEGSQNTEKNEELQLRDQLPHNFPIRVMVRCSKIDKSVRQVVKACDYHEHTSEEEATDSQEGQEHLMDDESDGVELE